MDGWMGHPVECLGGMTEDWRRREWHGMSSREQTGVDSVAGPGAASCDVADSCEGLLTPFAAPDGGQQKAAALVE